MKKLFVIILLQYFIAPLLVVYVLKAKFNYVEKTDLIKINRIANNNDDNMKARNYYRRHSDLKCSPSLSVR